jgi:DNA-binding HxlR family transcriptional regulator
MILNAVQSEILLTLSMIKRDETLRFSEIQAQPKFKGETHGYNMTLSRALNKLEENGWIIKYGKGTRKTAYGLNWRKKDIAETVTKLKSTPNPNDKFYPVELDTNALASELEKKRDDMEVELTLPHLDMVIAGERIDGFEKSVKHLEKNYKLLAEIVRFMNFIVMGRAEQNLINYKAQMEREGRDVNTREAQKEIFFKGYGKKLQPFHLIISWHPERFGYLASSPLGQNWWEWRLPQQNAESTHTEPKKRSRRKKKNQTSYSLSKK